jgi:hypothetical protein
MRKVRKWGTSNPFSEGHRKSLPLNYCLFDVDGIHISDNKLSIYEEKHRMDYKNGFNFIDSFHDPSNTQAGFLKTLSHNSDVWISEKITGKWWILRRGVLESTKMPNLIFQETENKIYIQTVINYRIHRLLSVILRTEGIKNNPNEVIADRISENFDIPKILVNDVHKDSYIYFKSDEKVEESRISNKFKSDWKKIWERFRIF